MEPTALLDKIQEFLSDNNQTVLMPSSVNWSVGFYIYPCVFGIIHIVITERSTCSFNVLSVHRLIMSQINNQT